MELFTDIFEYQYLMNAFLAAIFAGIVCGIVGTYVVARRMVFLCGGITHASFGGLGIALWAGFNPIGGAMIFAILSAMGIEWASDKGHIREDSAIGIIWSIGMAIGALFMSLTPGYTSGDLASYMFGSIVTVTNEDIILLGIFTALCVIGAALWWRPVMYLAFDRDFAMSQGIATRTASYFLTAIVAITIVLAIRIMGIVLLLSLFTIPAVAANSLTKSYPRITLWAAIIATVGAVAGLVASYNWEVPPGTCIIFILTLVLIAAKLLSLHLKTRLNASENHT
ncbi:MAG: metal ABC transporter permease [Rikenellaceae bacterium]|nr:metal ABC transporter permease [Rikenellaceae bacterium]